MKRFKIVFIETFFLILFFCISPVYSQNTEWIVYYISNSGLPASRVNSIAIDGSGNKWIGTSDGLAVFDGEVWTVYNTSNSDIPDYVINSIAIESNGIKWIGTFDGLASFDGNTWTVYSTIEFGITQ